MLFGMPLDVIGIIGIILLIGIVKKNGIMLIDFALASQRERGLTSEDAIHEACRLRFRPFVPKQIAWTVLATRAGTVERATIWSRVNSPADGVAERD